MSEPIELRPMGASASAPRIPPRHPAAADPTPGSLGAAYRSAEEKAKAAVHLQEGGLDAISIWGLGLASWFAVLGIPLLLFPRILLFFSQTAPPPSTVFSATQREEHYDALTPLESTLCLSLSLGLFAFSLISLFVLVPSYTPPTTNPSRTPLLGVLVGLLSVAGLTLWNAGGLGGLAQVVGAGNILVGIWGWWVVIFGGGRGKLSKKEKIKVPERFKKL
ncbi:hypothetical protein CI109_100317 [Kwoniella shandongensis]|uniref:Uncharacterized protein n=1 Tax=Kwoniella shandongensis TaxID=1734106 RepID=A0A5M6C409_9TREE|nr:uncharacterized protein CI109_001837 [Kwoniella shandongensis]KAA5529897.1 hypothetical protein CI109_001837 [Kwoniella shandongensis]